jgi:hypothetical protein
MRTRHLDEKEFRKAAKLLDLVRSKLTTFSNGDPELLFAYRRKIYKELTYDERGKPMFRRHLKKQKWEEIKGKRVFGSEVGIQHIRRGPEHAVGWRFEEC